jgi:hypothetical protein
MIKIRPLQFIIFVLLGAVGVTAGLALFAACAHAAVPAEQAPPQGIDATTVAAWTGALLSVAGILYAVLRIIAPRTKTLVDDEVRDILAELLTHARTQAAQGPAATTTVVVAQPASAAAPATEPTVHTASTSPGTISTITTLALTIGAALALQPGCATAKAVPGVAADAVIQCAKADSGQLLQLTGELAAAAVQSVANVGKVDWDALVAKAVAAGKEIGGCAFAAIY